MKKLGVVRDVFFISFAGYFAQGALYPQGSIISQFFLLLILMISAFYFIYTLLLSDNKNLFYKTWTAFLFLNVIGYILTGNFSDPKEFGMFKGILLGFLPYYPVYYFAQRNVLESKHLIRFFILMLPVAILSYFFNASEILSSRANLEDNIVNNMAYNFVALIPFVFLIKKNKILSIGLMAFLIFFIIQGAKRGALITGSVGLLIFLYYQLRTIEKKNRIRGFILTFIGICLLIFYAVDFFQKNEFLISRMQQLDEGGSGRSIIFAKIFSSWLDSENFLNLLFGYGFAASRELSGSFAHNDWLELLSNFGLLGVTLYAVLFYTTGKYIFNRQWSKDKRLLMLAIVLSWLTISLFSMGYTNQSDAFFRAILLAYLIGNKKGSLS